MSSRCLEVAVLLVALCVAGCEREARRFEPTGPDVPARAEDVDNVMIGRYEQNARALATGKRLFTWYNCVGCHANGGGGSGPALMDEVWTYGGDADAIYRSITQGRPGGMPAFGNRIPRDQVWQLAAYVRSMAAVAPLDAAPNREDAFLTRTPESFMDAQSDRPPSWRPGKTP